MGDIPADAEPVVDDPTAPRSIWAAPPAIVSATTDPETAPARLLHLNDHLAWMHKHWDLRPLAGPPRDHGWKGGVKRLVHRLVTAIFGPYLERMQDSLGGNVRAVDVIARRVDDLETSQTTQLAEMRADLAGLARRLDEHTGGPDDH